ncbi:MAG: ribosome-associated translation inhibitor RaiA [Terriglobales bacterium]|jgi:putative sigma-54 modulation protein
MNVEYTARKYVITPNIRKEVETGLNKIRKILGDRFETKVVLGVEKRQHKAEITIDPPNGPIVGMAQTSDMVSAVNEALDHLQKQALKYKTKWLSKKRKAVKKFDSQSLEDNIGAALGLAEDATFSVLVHKFPSVARTTEVHLVHAKDSVALRPLTLEEAIKEAHFRDKDVFVFRDPQGKLMVLHRTRDGKMELIEAP